MYVCSVLVGSRGRGHANNPSKGSVFSGGVGAGVCGCSHCPGVLTLLSHIDKGAFYPVATWQVGVET